MKKQGKPKDEKEKDPAFLFYSTKFYEGTRTLLPDERACLIDLMVYQHQHGFIPNDTRRMLMYCSGITEATLQATLQAKFKQTPSGWVNEPLAKVIKKRADDADSQHVNGTIGGWFRAAKDVLADRDYKKLQSIFRGWETDEKYQICSKNKPDQATLQAMLRRPPKRSLKDKDVIAIEDSIKDQNRKGGTGGETEVDPAASEIITYLNELADRDFAPDNKEHRKFVTARLKDGYTAEELKAIVALKVHEWKSDTKMSKYLRPSTLFNSEKAAIYRDEVATVRRTGIAPHKNGMSKIEERNERNARGVAAIMEQMEKEERQ